MRNEAMIFDRKIDSTRSLLTAAILILGFANFTAVSALIYIPLWPVPVTVQTLAVLLAGVCLGARAGALSQAVYLAEGLIGLPVFAGGNSGLNYALGPTGGYLVSFIVAAFVVGWLCDRGLGRRVITLVPTLAIGTLVIYLLGAGRLSLLIGLEGALVRGVFPFLAVDALKIVVAALVGPSARSLFATRRRAW